MKKILSLIVGIILFSTISAAAFDLPVFSEDIDIKIKMPGGIHYDMPLSDALAILKKRHPIEKHEEAAYYQVKQNGIEETYAVKFVCGKIWGIYYGISMTDEEAFYSGLEPFKEVIEKIRDHYFGPIYGDYKFKAQLDRNEKIRFECFDDWSENRVSFDCTISRGDYWMPPDTNCEGKK